MRTTLFVTILVICAALVGCTTSVTTIGGRDFDAAKLPEIKKGITTANELVALLGQPYNKTVKTENDVEWTYSWVKATTRRTDGWSVGNAHTVGDRKNLSVLVRNDVVINYSYNEGPFETDTKEVLVRQVPK